MLAADGVVAHDLAALRFVLLDLVQPDDGWTKGTLYPIAVDDLLHDSTGAPNLDILVAHRAVFVENEPVFDAQLAEELVAVVTLLRVAAHL